MYYNAVVTSIRIYKGVKLMYEIETADVTTDM